MVLQHRVCRPFQNDRAVTVETIKGTTAVLIIQQDPLVVTFRCAFCREFITAQVPSTVSFKNNGFNHLNALNRVLACSEECAAFHALQGVKPNAFY